MSARWLWPVLILAGVLRLIGIHYGLPLVFNADEPHIVNVAVSFGGGSLNPHLFKYPTLWMYSLFFFYGMFYLVWSLFGLMHSVREFGELFVWHPAPFYLLGRIAAAVFSVAGLIAVYRTGRLWRGRRGGVFAVAMLAASPALVEAGHAAKPESMMFFCTAWAWWFAVSYLGQGRSRELTLCGAMTGLACSCQYTALPLVVLIPTAWLARGRSLSRRPDAQVGASGLAQKKSLDLKSLLAALGAAAAAFAATSPFVLIDFSTFWKMAEDLRQMSLWVGVVPAGLWKHVVANAMTASGGWLGGVMLLVGAAQLCRKQRDWAWTLLVPIALFCLVLSFSFDGRNQRYMFAVYPAIALAAAIGAETLLEAAKLADVARNSAAHAVVLSLLLGPGVWFNARYVKELLLPDTRTEASAWIETHIPQGSRILIDQEHASPRVKPSLGLIEQMIGRTRTLDHPRRKYYEFMKSGHPGGGYWAYQIKRRARDLWTLPQYAAFSEAGRPVIDVSSGLEAARKAGIQFVVLTSVGATPSRDPDLAKFLMETERVGTLIGGFHPKPGAKVGPDIRIYGIEEKS